MPQVIIEQRGYEGTEEQAMKVQKPACPWEFYICKVLQGRITPAMRPMIMEADRLYMLPNCSVLLSRYERHGTLQDLLNAHLKAGKVRLHMCCMAALACHFAAVPYC